MIGMRTMLEVADNSGARKLQCILPRGGDLGLRAGLGDVITASVKEAAPIQASRRGRLFVAWWFVCARRPAAKTGLTFALIRTRPF
jgi:ribosomal protein L14